MKKTILTPLPIEAQISPINDLEIIDINNDGILDLICGGNQYDSEVETGRAETGIGLVLMGQKYENYLSKG